MRALRSVRYSVAIALFVVCANVGSAAAFAPPEIGRCVKVAGTGKFTSSSCIKEEKGKKAGQGNYEWLPGAENAKFTTTGGVGVLETVAGTSVTCKTQESGGEFSSPKTVKGIVVRFTKCESGGLTCGTAGAKEGEIVTNLIEGRIGFEDKAKKKIALDLFPAPSDDGLYVTFNCTAALHITVGGSVLVNVTSDKMLTSLTLKYTAKKGIQKPVKFEDEPEDVLLSEINGKHPEQSGITITSTQTSESKEALEANAVF
jgi:hypothetical protein